VSLSGLALALEHSEKARGNLAKQIWKLIAFLGRYAHQPADVSLRLPVDDLQSLASATGDLLEQESEAAQRKE